MHNDIWGEMAFHTGWKADTPLSFLNKDWIVTVKAQAYKKDEGISPEQEKAFRKFKNEEARFLSAASNELLKADSQAAGKYKLNELLFKRDGSCALLLDSKEDPDGGIAIQVLPQLRILDQDTFL